VVLAAVVADPVVAAARPDQVVTRASDDHVVVRCADQPVVAGGADERGDGAAAAEIAGGAGARRRAERDGAGCDKRERGGQLHHPARLRAPAIPVTAADVPVSQAWASSASKATLAQMRALREKLLAA
jgi:hypothetical protein